jgi:hypothetical protein
VRVHYRIWPKVAAAYFAVYVGVLIAAAAHWGI